jgi:hypothetical protein
VSYLQIPISDDYSLILAPVRADQPSSIIFHNHRTGEKLSITLDTVMPDGRLCPRQRLGWQKLKFKPDIREVKNTYVVRL